MFFTSQNDGTLLATGSYDGQARIWSPEGKTGLKPYEHESQLNGLG